MRKIAHLARGQMPRPRSTVTQDVKTDMRMPLYRVRTASDVDFLVVARQPHVDGKREYIVMFRVLAVLHY